MKRLPERIELLIYRGDNTKVYLGSTEVGAISALLGALPLVEEYFDRLAK